MPIVEAIMTAAAARGNNWLNDKSLSKRLEGAMAAAVQACHDEGTSDPEIIQARIIAAYREERARG